MLLRITLFLTLTTISLIAISAYSTYSKMPEAGLKQKLIEQDILNPVSYGGLDDKVIEQSRYSIVPLNAYDEVETLNIYPTIEEI